MGELLQLLKDKAVISPQEVARINEALAKDHETLARKWRELEAREEALSEREAKLNDRESSLSHQRAHTVTGEATEPSSTTHPSDNSQREAPAKGVDLAFSKDSKAKGIPLEASYDNGFSLSTPDKDLSLRIGGLLQTDYRSFFYDSEDPNKDKFDMRRVRLLLAGNITDRFDYKFEYEFQGAASRNLLDAYGDIHLLPQASFRVGQFKEPFGLEQSTKDKDLFFAERSMGFYLTPQRDLGVMAHASLWDERVNYAVGVFNGDGLDDSIGGDVDDLESTVRVTLSPFKGLGQTALKDLQLGGSVSYAPADRNNVDVHVKTTGLTSFFDVSSSAKFNVIQDVRDRLRFGAELGWAYGPFALMGEYFNLQFNDIETSTSIFDTEIQDYYIALLWMATGEKPSFKDGVLQPIKLSRSLWEGGWGGLGFGARYDHFLADDDAYDNLITAGVSVREATAYSVAANWFLSAYVRLILDYTRTEFDRPLIVGRDSTKGTALESDVEDVITARFQMGF